MIENRLFHARYADLHLHTNFSDGTMSPEEVVIEARHVGLDAIAITDHDILDGIEPASLAGKKHGVEVIPGIELSAEYNGEEVHMLGFYMDWQDRQFREKISEFRDSRRIRAIKMVDKLNELGVEIEYDDVFKQADLNSIGRPHVALALVERGHVATRSEAFQRFLADDGPAYMPKHKLSPAEAIALILDAGGIPVLAHPGSLQQDIIPELVSCGLMGLEAFHPQHAMELSDYYCDLARQHHILITGGSDCHGWVKDRLTIGDVRLPYEHIDALKRARKTILQELERAAN
ncbi:PHP domain-containing protein [Candidatus Poribacteria bacterium]